MKMGKFNKRRTPPKVGFRDTLQYAHRGSFFIVNGLRYNGVTGEVLPTSEQQFGAFDATGREDVMPVGGLPVGGDGMPPIAAESFEPGLIANSFDLLGSRKTSEHAEGQYWNYGTWRSPTGHYYFKNRIYYQPSYFAMDGDSRVTSNGQDGYMSTGSVVNTRLGGWQATSALSIFSGNRMTFVPEGHFFSVEKPDGVYNKFSWATLASGHLSWNNPSPTGPGTMITRVAERTFGNTFVNFSNPSAAPINFPSAPPGVASQILRFWIAPGSNFGIANVHLPKIGIVDTSGGPQALEMANIDFSDVHMFGGNVGSLTNYAPAVTINGREQNIFGGYLYTNSSNSIVNVGSGETGVRVFLTRNSTFSFYMLHDSEVGGIQGCDTATDNTARLTIRSLNHSSGATTVHTAIKKGVGGLVIPSQGVEDNVNIYSFYTIAFNGADTATQTMSIFKPSLNLVGGTVSMGNAYTNTMTTGQQQQFYLDMGHNNTAQGQWPLSNFRRNTVYRIWYSTSTTSVRRLHLGVYNTNATGVVTVANGFDASGSRGSMYKIYTWEINDATATATFINSINLNMQAPRYFYPLDSAWRDVYVGAIIGNDVIMSLSNSTGQYVKTIDLPYNAARIFKDRDGRWNTQVVDLGVPVVGNVYGSFTDVIAADVARTVSITASDRIFSYSGNTINSSILINVFDYQGTRLAKNVILSIIGQSDAPGVTFDDGSYTRTITTSNSANTIANVRIVSAVSAKIVGTVLES